MYLKLAYMQGQQAAMQSMQLDADAFAEFAEEDVTETKNSPDTEEQMMAKGVDTTPNWGGAGSLEGGDAGTRSYQMGLPRSGSV